jgi:hypothetical protein
MKNKKSKKAWNSGMKYSEEFKKIHFSNHPSKLKEKKQEIIDYYLQGNSQRKTAQKFGVTQAAICYILKKNKIVKVYIRTGENNPKWRGGICMDTNGRKLIYSPSHPKPDVDDIYCYEYRLIMEKHLGRYLEKGEIIHHINNNATDNRIENLKVMTQSEHINLHRRRGDLYARRE